ncbi:uncharacterized protein [Ptychodera flava]|uniref:uncharacterized protein n=1 Tax=Ptychodera flava TaxID=63121 RepID=UPI00396A73F4
MLRLVALVVTFLFLKKGEAQLPDPAAFWPLDGEYMFQDASGNDNNGSPGSDVHFEPNAVGTRNGAMRFTGTDDSYIEFPNNGAYDTRYSIAMFAYVYQQGMYGPIFNYRHIGWGIHLNAGNSVVLTRLYERSTSEETVDLRITAPLNHWKFYGSSYNHITGMFKLWEMDHVLKSVNVGTIELATDHPGRMGASTDATAQFMVSCMQIYDRELSPSEIIEAESKCQILNEMTTTAEATTTAEMTTTEVTTAEPTTTKEPTTTDITTEPETTTQVQTTTEMGTTSNAPTKLPGTTTQEITTIDGKVRDIEGTNASPSISEVVEYFDGLADAISGLDDASISQEQSQNMTIDVLKKMDTAIEAFWSSSPETEKHNPDRDILTVSVLNTTKTLSNFVLRNMEPGTGSVLLETQVLQLNLESDTAGDLTECFLDMGDGNGFDIPAAEKISSNFASVAESLNRIVTVFKRRSLKRDNTANDPPVNDVLTLSFTDREGEEIQVNNTEEYIQITFGYDVPSPETIVLTGGQYLHEQDVTYFGSKFQVSQLHHAIIILLTISKPIHVNTTAYIFNKVVMYSDQYQDYQLSLAVHFNGNTSSLFIPEHYFMKTGEYYLTFTIPKRHEVRLSMAVKPTICGYLNEDISRPTWDTSGCKVSSTSSLSSTVCLCNHLTTFTTNPL